MEKIIVGVFLGFEILLVGCGTTFDHEDLRARIFEGDDFSAALAEEYRALAVFEADEMNDWPDAGLFGKKAMSAARREMPQPERIADWRLPEAAVGELSDARSRLVAFIERGGAKASPAAAAHAQASFDCWIEQQEENWQTEDIARCRKDFYNALADVEAELMMRAQSRAIPVAAVMESESAAGLVLFAFDSAVLADDGMSALRELAERVKASGNSTRILVGGHTDRAGADGYNLALSWRRADAVRSVFVDFGVPPSRVNVAAFGEKRPRVETADGAAEPRNRRVEIVVGPSADL